MPSPSRRQFLSSLPAAAAGVMLSQCSTPEPEAPLLTETIPGSPTLYRGRLPYSSVFIGDSKFQSLCDQARRENWAALPQGERTMAVAKALLGTPYGNYTLEIDDRIEAPSVNFTQLDCWTYYETSLAFARLVKSQPEPWTGPDMLRCIEMERYRGGHCDGTYLSRMHHLEEVFYDNERRGLGRNVTRSLGGVPIHRNIREMQIAWHHYRYLSHNPSLRSGIAKVEARVSKLPVHYIPRTHVSGIESEIQTGDILAIVSGDDSGYTSHVGMALREGPTCRFVHATSMHDKGHRCIIDGRISHYLAERADHIGLIVFRPGEAV